MNHHPSPSPCIGVFDSGVGGLSVLRALRQRLPEAPLIYLGDVAYAPYGERDPADVVARSDRIVARLTAMGASVIVVACNTATVLGIAALRDRWPALSFVGVEPGVKPAAVLTRTRRIAVMATPATARSARLRHLIDSFAAGVHVHVEPCPGLAALIERGADDAAELHAMLAPSCANIATARVDTVVLGCTHYPFVADAIRGLLGAHITLLDTAPAVAERVAAVWRDAAEPRASLRVLSTAESAAMATLLRRCEGLDAAVELAPI